MSFKPADLCKYKKIAISTDQAVPLLDAESFGKLADVPNAVVFLPKSQTFILVIGTETWATGYKNYQDLKSEAERQYPGLIYTHLAFDFYHFPFEIR